MTAALRAVDIPTMIDVDHRDGAGGVVNAIDDPVGTPPSTEPVIQRGKQVLAYPVGFADQGPGHEFVCRDRDRLRQPFAERPAHGEGGPQLVRFGGGLLAHAAEDRRRRMASARSSAASTSPRASSASDSASRRSVAGSPRTDSVSSNRSRSSTDSSTADGRPWTVTVTRSWWSWTRPTSSDRCVLTSPSGNVVMVKSMTKNSAHVHS